MVKSFATGKLYKRHLDHLVHSICVPTGGLMHALPLPDEVLPSVSGPAAALEPSQTSASPEETAVASPGVAGHQPRSLAASRCFAILCLCQFSMDSGSKLQDVTAVH